MGFERACGLVDMVHLIAQQCLDRIFISFQSRYQLAIGQLFRLRLFALFLQFQCGISQLGVGATLGQAFFKQPLLFRRLKHAYECLGCGSDTQTGLGDVSLKVLAVVLIGALDQAKGTHTIDAGCLQPFGCQAFLDERLPGHLVNRVSDLLQTPDTQSGNHAQEHQYQGKADTKSGANF